MSAPKFTPERYRLYLETTPEGGARLTCVERSKRPGDEYTPLDDIAPELQALFAKFAAAPMMHRELEMLLSAMERSVEDPDDEYFIAELEFERVDLDRVRARLAQARGEKEAGQ